MHVLGVLYPLSFNQSAIRGNDISLSFRKSVIISLSLWWWLECGDHHKIEEWIWTVKDRNALVSLPPNRTIPPRWSGVNKINLSIVLKNANTCKKFY